jgi:hypothetical protein
MDPFRSAEAWEDGQILALWDRAMKDVAAGFFKETFVPGKRKSGALPLRFAQLLLSSRPAIIEECARVCEDVGTQSAGWRDDFRQATQNCASAIRALAPWGQNAAQEYEVWTNGNLRVTVEGHASSVTDTQGNVYVLAEEDAAPQVTGREQSRATGDGQPDVSSAGPAVAAEALATEIERWIGAVAGNGSVSSVAADQCRKRIMEFAALRAAPSLSREEWGMLSKALDLYINKLSFAPIGADWEALRAKVRSLSHPEEK